MAGLRFSDEWDPTALESVRFQRRWSRSIRLRRLSKDCGSRAKPGTLLREFRGNGKSPVQIVMTTPVNTLVPTGATPHRIDFATFVRLGELGIYPLLLERAGKRANRMQLRCILSRFGKPNPK